MRILTVSMTLVLGHLLGANAASCSDGWISYRSHCYFIGFDTRLSFYVSRMYCRLKGAYLTRLETYSEYFFLRKLLKGTRAFSAWTSLTDQKYEGVWQWYGTNEPAEFSDWARGNPNNDKNEDCMGFFDRGDYMWNDFRCDSRLIPICEKS